MNNRQFDALTYRACGVAVACLVIILLAGCGGGGDAQVDTPTDLVGPPSCAQGACK